jgi:hypothetical protein
MNKVRERERVEVPFAYCCAEGGGSVSGCDCVNKDHGTAWTHLQDQKAQPVSLDGRE